MCCDNNLMVCVEINISTTTQYWGNNKFSKYCLNKLIFDP